jgi:hypothetical protein
MGYGLFLWRDKEDNLAARYPADGRVVITVGEYPGYAKACNWLTRAAFELDSSCNWVVCAGDDTEPDMNRKPEEIAVECALHFSEHVDHALPELIKRSCTFGVMQPTGHRWGDARGPYIDRVCGSPWIGREFARRMYQGTGPYWPEYTHMGVDEELQEVAIKYGVLWQRPDLIHLHRHWGLPADGEKFATRDRMPPHLKEANTPEHWHRYKRIIESRREAGFPGSEPIA